MIYFEDVCKLILRKFREDDETEFIKIMFKVRELNSSLSSRYPNKFPIIADVRKQISLFWTIYVLDIEGRKIAETKLRKTLRYSSVQTIKCYFSPHPISPKDKSKYMRMNFYNLKLRVHRLEYNNRIKYKVSKPVSNNENII